MLEMYHGLYDISVKYGEGYLKVMAKVHKNNEQKFVNFMHTYLLGFAIILTVNTPNTLYSFLLPP